MKRLLLVVVVVVATIGLTPSVATAAPIGYTGATISGMDLIYTVDMATGGMTLVGDTGLEPATRALTLAPDGTLYGANEGSLYTIDTSTGAATLVGAFGCCGIVEDMTFDAAGDMWAISGNPSSLYSVDPSTGSATLAGPLNSGLLSGLAGDCTGSVFATDSETDDLLTVNTGAATTAVVGPFGVDVGSGSLSFDAGGALWMMMRPASPPGASSQTLTVDTSTGAGTVVAPSVAGNNPSDVALGPLVCPDPPPTSPTSSPSSSSSSVAPGAAAAGTTNPRFTG